jgi:hypothetical protein
MTSYKIIGIDMQNTACECCGREELKAVVILRGEAGDVRFGRGCAAKAMGHRRTARDIDLIATTRTIQDAERAAYAYGWTSRIIGPMGYGKVIATTDGRLFAATGCVVSQSEIDAAYPGRKWFRLAKTIWVTAD